MELIINEALPHQGAPYAPDARVTHKTRVTAMDGPLLYTTLALVVFGLVSVYSASAHEAQLETGNSFSILFKQIIATGIGLVALFTLSRINFQLWRRTAKILSLLTIGLLVATMVVGVTVHGSERWIPLPFGFQFQPSDLAKLATVILMAQVASQRRLFSFTFFLNLALIGVMTLLIYQQPNLSVSIILTLTTGAMLFMSGFPVYLFVAIIPFAAYGVWQKILETPYQKRRIDGWLDPWAYPQDAGYNLIQSFYAIGSGGLFGAGYGHSIQKLYYLPFPYTDFIFSVICEEWGLFGGLAVVGMFALFAWRGFAIAFNCPSNFGQMLAFGITTVITLQAAINLCVTLGLMPVTGVTLPLISYGGTSMIVTLAMIGILLSISRYKITAHVSEL